MFKDNETPTSRIEKGLLEAKINSLREEVKSLEEMPLSSDFAKIARDSFVAEEKEKLARLETLQKESQAARNNDVKKSIAYKFDPTDAFVRIATHWKQWDKSVHPKCYVVGISGGKDSTVVAALASKIFGVDNVLGVMMPNGEQKDISDSKEVCKFLGIKSVTVNIGKAFEELQDEIVYEALQICGIKKPSVDTITNMPARLRMTTLYAIAQSVGGIVLNTCNASEDCLGYSSIFGDNAGSYAPIQGLTVTEIRALGDWLGLPHNLVHKTPIDGLQPLSDEDKLGFTYADLDRYIREDIGTPEFKEKINEIYRRNKFKTDIVQIPHPDFDCLGNFVRYNNLPDVMANRVKD